MKYLQNPCPKVILSATCSSPCLKPASRIREPWTNPRATALPPVLPDVSMEADKIDGTCSMRDEVRHSYMILAEL
jgi:hypothetical protein